MPDFLFLLAQDTAILDPTGIGEKLGKAQDVQQILGIIIGVLIFVVVTLVAWYLRERKAWGEEKASIHEAHGKAKAKAITAHGGERLAWEVERGKHSAQLTEVAEQAADGRETLMREMLELALRIEKALDRLAEWKEARKEQQ